MRLPTLPLLAMLFVSLLAARPAAAESIVYDSDEDDVKARIEKQGYVVWGVSFDLAEKGKFALAAAASVASANAGPVLAYFEDYGNRTIETVRRQAPELAYRIVKDMVIQALADGGKTIRHGRLEITGGLATYKNWKRIVYHEPRQKRVKKYINRRLNIWTYVWKTVLVKVERQVALPNDHQPYLVIKIKGPRPPSNGSGTPRPRPKTRYSTITITNHMPFPLHFDFRWERDPRFVRIVLQPGQGQLFFTTGNAGVPIVQTDWDAGPGVLVQARKLGYRPLLLRRAPLAHEAVQYHVLSVGRFMQAQPQRVP